jgi:hypothetical protein
MKCATCNETNGCEHIFRAADAETFQQQYLIEVSEAADGEKKVAPRSAITGPDKAEPYVPGQRDYIAKPIAGEQRGPSVIMSHGPAGPVGATGATGLPGKDGKDADTEEVVSLATRTMESCLAKFEANVRNMLTITLQRAGVIDLNGHAILLPGPQGKPGLSIKGDPGKDGESIVGPAGRNGIDGQSIVGPAGRDGSITEATKAAKEYVQREIADLTLGMKEMILQILVERNVLDHDGKAIPGPRGSEGIPGPQGKPGNLDACERLIERKLEEFRKEIGSCSNPTP